MVDTLSKQRWHERHRDSHNERQRQLYHKRCGREVAPPKRAYEQRKRRGLPEAQTVRIERRVVVVTFD